MNLEANSDEALSLFTRFQKRTPSAFGLHYKAQNRLLFTQVAGYISGCESRNMSKDDFVLQVD